MYGLGISTSKYNVFFYNKYTYTSSRVFKALIKSNDEFTKLVILSQTSTVLSALPIWQGLAYDYAS